MSGESVNIENMQSRVCERSAQAAISPPGSKRSVITPRCFGFAVRRFPRSLSTRAERKHGRLLRSRAGNQREMDTKSVQTAGEHHAAPPTKLHVKAQQRLIPEKCWILNIKMGASETTKVSQIILTN